MPFRIFFFSIFLFFADVAKAQTTDPLIADTTDFDYDDLFSELESFLDSITAPRNFTIINVGLSSGFFSDESNSAKGESIRKLILSPSFGYYHKSGFGIGAGASLLNSGNNLNPYQYSITGSYDFQKSKAFITGISLTHYLTKKNLSFYTSPLRNDLYAYFTYRKLWFKPSVGLSYGWGTKEDLVIQEQKIQRARLRKNGFTRINTKESVQDFNLTTSVRHDFYFLNALSKRDYIRITPQLSFTSGTQQFGFNQTSNSYIATKRANRSILLNSDIVSLDNHLYYQPISLTGFLKTEYSKGAFFVQPQLIFDYYFPAAANRFTTSFLINAGLIF